MKSVLVVFSLLLLAMVGVSTGDHAQESNKWGQQQQYQQFGQTSGMDTNMKLMMVSERKT